MLPTARRQGLIIEDAVGELVVYDTDRDKAHCLSPTAAQVWRLCDGRTTPDEICDRVREQIPKADKELVLMVLHRLGKLSLLESKFDLPQDAINSSRRTLIRKVAMAGGLAALLTITISAPTPADASTGGGEGSVPSRGRRGHRGYRGHNAPGHDGDSGEGDRCFRSEADQRFRREADHHRSEATLVKSSWLNSNKGT